MEQISSSSLFQHFQWNGSSIVSYYCIFQWNKCTVVPYYYIFNGLNPQLCLISAFSMEYSHTLFFMCNKINPHSCIIWPFFNKTNSQLYIVLAFSSIKQILSNTLFYPFQSNKTPAVSYSSIFSKRKPQSHLFLSLWTICKNSSIL